MFQQISLLYIVLNGPLPKSIYSLICEIYFISNIQKSHYFHIQPQNQRPIKYIYMDRWGVQVKLKMRLMNCTVNSLLNCKWWLIQYTDGKCTADVILHVLSLIHTDNHYSISLKRDTAIVNSLSVSNFLIFPLWALNAQKQSWCPKAIALGYYWYYWMCRYCYSIYNTISRYTWQQKWFLMWEDSAI